MIGAAAGSTGRATPRPNTHSPRTYSTGRPGWAPRTETDTSRAVVPRGAGLSATSVEFTAGRRAVSIVGASAEGLK